MLENPKVNYISNLLGIVAWDYPEMPGLEQKLVEHILPIKVGFTPTNNPQANDVGIYVESQR